MGRTIEKNGHKIEVVQKGLQMGTLQFTPGESHLLKSCLSWAGKLANAPVLPPEVGHHPFVVRFGTEGVHSLERTDKAGFVKFAMRDLDTIIELVDNGVACHSTNLEVQKLDRLKRGPRGSGNASGNGPDTFDGRF